MTSIVVKFSQNFFTQTKRYNDLFHQWFDLIHMFGLRLIMVIENIVLEVVIFSLKGCLPSQLCIQREVTSFEITDKPSYIRAINL
jgi:hypothetical protein